MTGDEKSGGVIPGKRKCLLDDGTNVNLYSQMDKRRPLTWSMIARLTGILCNGLLLFLFFKEKSLRENSSMRLVLFLVAINFSLAITTLPYSIYLTVSWNPVYVNLNPYITMLFGAPIVFHSKIDLTLIVSLAVERILALFFPVAFRRLSSSSSSSYPKYCLLFGILTGSIDLILQFYLTNVHYVPNCAALGCFLDLRFLSYWGFSNSANRISAGILILSLICVAIPSIVIVIIGKMFKSTFNIVGPFYVVGLLCAGTFNSILYVIINEDLRRSASNVFCTKRSLPNKFVSTVNTAVISRS
ncbi:hypothetical protein DICVIV_03647 [Dictyocaulus viviparus]|uniref:G-protein coupled receptors family 1 profile domain-containing protein n=1 Tax=Dictyocaulus viviparus TaxID=29172 RepID=A0A0D8Y027_DICVI|nr:hypothetical protein DICVIV_03647 [Dictyocaulus viviparus]